MAKTDRSDETTGTDLVPVEQPTDAALASNPMLAFRPQEVRDLSWDELMAELGDSNVAITDMAQVGDGFRVLESANQKSHLVGVPFMILPGWRVNPSDKLPGRYFTTFYLKTKNPVEALGGGQHFIVNDGSTGIARQLEERYEKRGNTHEFIACRKGLLKSTYTVTEDAIDDNGDPIIDPKTHRPQQRPVLDPVTNEKITGTTFYLDDSV